PRGDLLAGFVGCRRQRQQCGTIALEPFADGLCMPAQSPLTPLPAIGFQMQVQLVPTARTRNRNHEVPSRVADQPFYLALVVALGRTTELVGKQIVTL